MVKYRSDVPKNRDAVYTIDGDWFSVSDHNGVIKFHIPVESKKEPLYLGLFGHPGEPIRDEIDRVLEAVAFMRRGPRGMTMETFEEAIAHILGMKYGRYQEKKRKGEIQYLQKTEVMGVRR